MADQFHAFISYAQADGEIAASIASALGDLGLKSFLSEKEIALDVNWEDSVKEAIRHSCVLLCLVTQNSKRSVWVHAEAGAAWVLEKPIIPALYEVDPNELIEILRRHQGRRIDSPEALQRFLEDVATMVSKISMLPFVERRTSPVPGGRHSESFTESRVWENLLKIGPWSRDPATGAFKGRGIHNYILSSNHYAPPFSINARVAFYELSGVSKLDAVNAGIVFGWGTPSNIRRYFNILINEEHIWLELIGSRGGDAYLDFWHLDGGIRFELSTGEPYEFNILFENGILVLQVTDAKSRRWDYDVALPDRVEGRIGLRPWRSTVKCNHFIVSER